jgi:CRISPR-associated protein Csb3
MSIEISVDVANPGHYFAACGLFELAGRLDRSAHAHFSGREFRLATELTLSVVITSVVATGFSVEAQEADPDEVEEDDEGSDAAAPLRVGGPFDIVLDWWNTAHGKDLKLWAGTMNGPRIAQAMLAAVADARLHTASLLDHACVVFDPTNQKKKVEPFYFDARRAGNASSRDVGFAPNDLKLETLAFPAVEALCLIGLQRFRPHRVERRVFEYSVWREPLPLLVAPVVCAGEAPSPTTDRYRFESWSRTSKGYHKAFKPATLRREGDE